MELHLNGFSESGRQEGAGRQARGRGSTGCSHQREPSPRIKHWGGAMRQGGSLRHPSDSAESRPWAAAVVGLHEHALWGLPQPSPTGGAPSTAISTMAEVLHIPSAKGATRGASLVALWTQKVKEGQWLPGSWGLLSCSGGRGGRVWPKQAASWPQPLAPLSTRGQRPEAWAQTALLAQKHPGLALHRACGGVGQGPTAGAKQAQRARQLKLRQPPPHPCPHYSARVRVRVRVVAAGGRGWQQRQGQLSSPLWQVCLPGRAMLPLHKHWGGGIRLLHHPRWSRAPNACRMEEPG